MSENDYTPEIPTKKCTCCKVFLPATPEYFHRHANSPDGLRPVCKTCRHTQNANLSPEQREKNRQRRKELYSTPEGKAGQKRRGDKYRHTEKGKQNSKKTVKRYRSSEKGRIANKSANHRRRLRIKINGGSYTHTDIALQKKAQTDKKKVLRCWWCGKPILDNYTIDHRIPLEKGGSNWPSNIVLAHSHCNHQKGNRLPSIYGRLF